MRLKDYIFDRLKYIVFYYVSISIVVVIMMLELIIKKESVNIENIVYAFVMATVLLIVLIVIDYLPKRSFYRAINKGLDKENISNYIFNIPVSINREHHILKRLLTKNYMLYENALSKYKKSYKTQMDFKSRWIHQMKTPVSVIKLILENEKDKAIDAQTRKSYESIEEEIEKLSHGLEMELYSLRINDFEMDLKIEEVDILEIVRTIINENKNAFIVNSIYPKVEIDNSIVVKTDKKWLKFLISQIISNSIKYTKVKDTENKYLQIKLQKSPDKAVLSIEDNGVGVPAEDVDRVFNPFFTGSNGRRYLESTGMGLYLSKDICKKLGHDIQLASVEGEWTRVSITFYDGRSIYNLS